MGLSIRAIYYRRKWSNSDKKNWKLINNYEACTDRPRDRCPVFLPRDEVWSRDPKRESAVVAVVVASLEDVVLGVELPPDTMPVIL